MSGAPASADCSQNILLGEVCNIWKGVVWQETLSVLLG
jgi:hypothetical protein